MFLAKTETEYPKTPGDLPPDCRLATLRDRAETATARQDEFRAKRARWKTRLREVEQAINEADPDVADFVVVAGWTAEAVALRRRLDVTEAEARHLAADVDDHGREWDRAWSAYLTLVRRLERSDYSDRNGMPMSREKVVAEIESWL